MEGDVASLIAWLQVGALTINALLALIIWPLRNSINDLKASDDRLGAKIQTLEIKIAEEYVRRNEVSASLNAIYLKLDTIQDRLERRIETVTRHDDPKTRSADPCS